jgi:AraC-like DNA-binding protein
MVEIFDDIRKIYRFATPCEELSPYVEFFSETCPEQSRHYFPDGLFSVTMFSSWTPTIWINLRAAYGLELEEKKYQVPSGRDILLLRNNLVTRNVSSADRICTIKFFPGSLQAIFGVSQHALINRVVEASDLFPGALIEKIKLQQDLHSRVALIEAFLLKKLLGQKKEDHYIKLMRDSVDLYRSSGMHCNTTQIAAKQFTSSKTINRYFNRAVGLSPKKYLSILRARAALTGFCNKKNGFEPEQFGYYDMSHFYRAAQQFTGRRMRPTA